MGVYLCLSVCAHAHKNPRNFTTVFLIANATYICFLPFLAVAKRLRCVFCYTVVLACIFCMRQWLVLCLHVDFRKSVNRVFASCEKRNTEEKERNDACLNHTEDGPPSPVSFIARRPCWKWWKQIWQQCRLLQGLFAGKSTIYLVGLDLSWKCNS